MQVQPGTLPKIGGSIPESCKTRPNNCKTSLKSNFASQSCQPQAPKSDLRERVQWLAAKIFTPRNVVKF